MKLLAALLLAQAAAAPARDRLADWFVSISKSGRSVALALPSVEPASPAVADAAHVLSDVIWSDLQFAAAFRLTDKRSYPPPPINPAAVDFYKWEAAGADLVVYSRAGSSGEGLGVDVRIFAVASKQELFGTRYDGKLRSVRALGHYISDDVLAKVDRVGIAQTKIAFTSDREAGTEKRKEVYLMDYDGYAPQPLTQNRSLNLSPAWSPDARALAYVSYVNGQSDIFRTFLFRGGSEFLVGKAGMTFTPSWSPDGSQIAFASTRDGNSEIYVVTKDGSGLKRLTRHDASDIAPTWSPSGREIAFTSDRNGSPQIYVMDSDGLNVRQISFQGTYNDAAAWSPSRRFSEIAWASRIDRGSTFEIDVVVFNLETSQVRQLTVNKGVNESPSWSPDGEHIVFSSNRTGTHQIFSMRRGDGSDPRQLTREGQNQTPKWGPLAGKGGN